MVITIVLFILGLIFIFAFPPLGIIFFILAILGLIISVLKGTGKAAISTGKFISKSINTKKCPYCYSQIDIKATVCPLCHRDLISDNNMEENDSIEYNDENNSESLTQEDIKISIHDYTEKASELSKIYNLYKNEIYTEQEYKNKKEKWINSLKRLDFSKVETDFLNEILPFVKDNILENNELQTIKYIVSGEYAEDQHKKEYAQRLKAEEEARKKREETINNIKNKTKEVTSTTINKINSIVRNSSNNTTEELICSCGERLVKDAIYCPNCGKKVR